MPKRPNILWVMTDQQRADDPAYAEELTGLRSRLFEWHVLTEDPLDSSDGRRFETDYPW